MHTLTRRVRMIVNTGEATSRPASGYAGTPSPVGLPAFYEFAVVVRGEPDPSTGYVLDIKVIDDAAQRALRPWLTRAAEGPPSEAEPTTWLSPAAESLADILPTLASLRLGTTPFLSYEVSMPAPTTVILRQRFDFAAAHRLHVPTLTQEENRTLFGKCNNEKGHGHNYQFEPAIAVDAGAVLPVHAVEHVCKLTILDRFDHKHLNEDCAEFNLAKGGVNPSVENIARVFFKLLAPAVQAIPGARLAAITVWETDRTSATYSAT